MILLLNSSSFDIDISSIAIALSLSKINLPYLSDIRPRVINSFFVWQLGYEVIIRSKKGVLASGKKLLVVVSV